MFAKVLILALAVSANAQLLTKSVYGAGLGLTGGVPVYRSSANYGGLVAANGWGYGANLGRVAGLGALRTGAIGYGGALGYGSGALIAGAPAVSTLAVGAVPAAVGVNHYGLGLGYAGLGVAKGLSVHQAGPVNAAVHTVSRTVDYTAVPYTGEAPTVQDIDVPPQESPLRINFQSRSSPLAVSQQHIPAEPGQVQVTQSEDEPHKLIHTVTRPVVQEVNEIVQPYRTLNQQVQPVIESTHTNIAQGEGVRLTGLTSGIVGGTGVLAASGLGVAAPAVAKVGLGYAGYGLAAPAVAKVGLGYSGYGAGYGYAAPAGVVGLGGLRTLGLANAGLYGTGVVKSGLVNTGLYGAGLGYGYGLGGLSGLSSYGTTAKIARFAY